MTRGALLVLALLVAAAPARPADVYVIDIAVEPGGVRTAAVWRAPGTPTAGAPDLLERDLAPGALSFAILGEPSPGGNADPEAPDGPPVLARGLLPDASAVVEAEDTVSGKLLAYATTVPRTLVQVRVSEAHPPRRLLVYRQAAPGTAPARTKIAEVALTSVAAEESKFPETLIHGMQTANRAHVQILADGFTETALSARSRFEPESRALVRALLDQKPFERYGHLLAVSVVKSPSPDSGVSEEDGEQNRGGFGVQLVHMREGDRVVSRADGSPRWRSRSLVLPDQAFDRLVRANVSSGPHVRVVLASTPALTGTALGTGSPAPVVLLGLGFRDWRFVHMMGHALGGLGDEYTASPPRCDRAFLGHPNLGLAGAPVPWQALVDFGEIGAPQGGGHLCDQRYVHPRAVCVMHRDALESGFCPACQQALLEGIYARAHLVDAIEPAAKVLALDTPAPPTFTARLNVTARVTLRAEWYLDQRPSTLAPVTGTALTFVPPAQQWTPGHHVVRLLVWDITTLQGGVGPQVTSFPHEVRWDVHVRAAAPAALVPVASFEGAAKLGP